MAKFADDICTYILNRYWYIDIDIVIKAANDRKPYYFIGGG